MNVQGSIWQELLVVFGGNAMLLLVLGFLFKSLLSQMLTKDVEKFKAELKADADTSIERLKPSLQMTALEHQVRFSNLHEKRAEVLAEIYRRLVEGHAEVFRYVNQFGKRGDQEMYVAVVKKIFEFSDFVESHKIYLPEQTFALLQKFTHELRRPVANIWVFSQIEFPTPETMSQTSKAFTEAFEAFEGPLKEVKLLIEAEFRRILDGPESAPTTR